MLFGHGRPRSRVLVVSLIAFVGFYVGSVLYPILGAILQLPHEPHHCPLPGPVIVQKPVADAAPKPTDTAPLASHTRLSNGLLEVNPDGGHPILELIKTAEEEWSSKIARASRTLEEAVIEYKRRYNRPPPKGFDDWWNYAQENNVQLPDEYDFLWRDLEPFWGIDPQELLKIQAIQETETDSFTIGKNETHETDLIAVAFSDPDTWEQRHLLRGLDEILDLLDPIEELLPPFRAVFSPHDNPNLLSDYHVKKATLDAAKAGTYVDLSKLGTPRHLGFASACPPGSPARVVNAPINQLVRPPPRVNRTFIHDHRLAMDPCTNPHILYNHAQYVAHDLGPSPRPVIAAQFAYCSTPLFHDIQPPTFIAWMEDIYPRENDPEWENKTDERLLWRGSNTGMNHDASTRWIYSQRIHLMSWANELSGTVNILMPGQDGDNSRVGNGTEVKRALINPAITDIAFTGAPMACSPQSYCDYLGTLFEWRGKQSANGKDAGSHKYIMDVDGNGWSSRFKRLITTNSLIFKATAYPEWWIDRVQPWVHYVPVQVDYSDLYDAYVFFRGGLYGEGNHDDLARKIATAGRTWSKSFWRKEDMTAYFFRLLLEYARIMSPDREAMSYTG